MSLTEDDLVSLIEVIHGDLPGSDEITLVCVVRNNYFLMEAFLNHHRALGVSKFLILDDWSDESFLNLLKSHTDVTILRVPMRFPERLSWTGHNGEKTIESAGGTYKDIISRNLVKHPWSIVLDTDEFLILAPELRDLNHFFSEVDPDHFGVFGAQMVDMVPTGWPPKPLKASPESFADLVALYPMFKPSPAWRRTSAGIEWLADCNAISDIFRHIGVYSGPPPIRLLKRLFRPFLPGMRAFPRSDITKVPLVGPLHRHLRRSHHAVDAPIDGPMVLALAHFTFTHDLPRKVSEYLNTRSGKNRFASWTRYEAYSRLLKKLQSKGNVDFSQLGLVPYIDSHSFSDPGICEASLGDAPLD